MPAWNNYAGGHDRFDLCQLWRSLVSVYGAVPLCWGTHANGCCQRDSIFDAQQHIQSYMQKASQSRPVCDDPVGKATPA